MKTYTLKFPNGSKTLYLNLIEATTAGRDLSRWLSDCELHCSDGTVIKFKEGKRV